MINGIHHVSLATTDLDRLLTFYRDVLGLSMRYLVDFEDCEEGFETIVGMKNVRGRAASLRAGNVQIEFFQYTQPKAEPVTKRPACDGGIRHLCFDVTDIFSEYRRLVEAGVEFISKPQMLKHHVCAVYARDPDGNIVELQEILEGSSAERVPMPARY